MEAYSVGSVWHRWDPHIHGPGTLLNDQFKSDDPWPDYLARIESASPTLHALGVTDYGSIATYERLCGFKREGRLPDVALMFPNIELRLLVGTGTDTAVNLHLLVSPDDADHIDQTKRFLLSLTFERKGETYRCEPDDLMKLGRAHKGTIEDDNKALEEGTNQFKVEFSAVRNARKNSTWARTNILFAVSGSSVDGTAGLQKDSSFSSVRKEIEAEADIIFSAQPNSRTFWLGQGTASLQEIEREWGGRKPCLHGSDAHSPAAVANPAKGRYCWVKGELIFESLRQACIEPETRVFLGLEPPSTARPSQTITSMSILDADWVSPEPIRLNPGLVAIIGPRGSGKTALADILAAGTDAAEWDNSRSFLHRARELLKGSEVSVTWGDDTHGETSLDGPQTGDDVYAPGVRYLSQQFVERLCLSEGVSDELLEEMERVVFQAYPREQRTGIASFAELLESKTVKHRSALRREREVLTSISDALVQERAAKAGIPALGRQLTELESRVAAEQRDMDQLLKAVPGADRQRIAEVTEAQAVRSEHLARRMRRKTALIQLEEEVDDMEQHFVPNFDLRIRTDCADAPLTTDQWGMFTLGFSGDVSGLLNQRNAAEDKQISTLQGPAVPQLSAEELSAAPSYLIGGAKLTDQPISVLEAELRRLHALAGIDAANNRKVAVLQAAITKGTVDIAQLKERIAHAKLADERINDLISKRASAYEKSFAALISEEGQLRALYEPLSARLANQSGSLQKLAFRVQRRVDMERWTKLGEAMLDLRKSGPFQSQGTLLKTSEDTLMSAWSSGSAADVSAAMQAFRDENEDALMAHAPKDAAAGAGRQQWARQISAWLYSSDHINIAYSIQYDGVDVAQLSPGTRGILLLLLYLVIDTEDDRPLIVDQPEENLDPQSIYSELVEHFRRAKQRRQIVIVTHNANLVVNTDADQVIVACSGSHVPGRLPKMRYQSGGLEDAGIRKQVCDILEGGERAFKERAKRLRLRLD